MPKSGPGGLKRSAGGCRRWVRQRGLGRLAGCCRLSLLLLPQHVAVSASKESPLHSIHASTCSHTVFVLPACLPAAPCRARLLADDVRAATVAYLSVIKGAEGGVTKLSVPRFHMHPALQRAYSSVEAAFRQVRVCCCS